MDGTLTLTCPTPGPLARLGSVTVVTVGPCAQHHKEKECLVIKVLSSFDKHAMGTLVKTTCTANSAQLQ